MKAEEIKAPRGKKSDELIKETQDNGICVNDTAKSLIKKIILSGNQFKGSRKIKPVIITLEKLELSDGGTLKEIVRAAKKIGLKPLRGIHPPITASKLPNNTWDNYQNIFIEEDIKIGKKEYLGSLFQIHEGRLQAFQINRETVIGRKMRNFRNSDIRLIFRS